MSMTWGPGLDAELAYRREQVALVAARRGLARFRRRHVAVAAQAAPRTLPNRAQATATATGTASVAGPTTGARAA